jgi:aspartate ammonia-lyase
LHIWRQNRYKHPMESYRKEHDSLGQVEVPIDALYGAQTVRALQNFPISGRTAHPSLIRGFLKIKAAAAHANRLSKALSEESSALVTQAVAKVIQKNEEEWKKIFPVDPYQAGAGTSQNMNVNEVIANVANLCAGAKLGVYSPIHPNDDVNRSQSTNDTFPTAMRLALLEDSKSLQAQLDKLSESFAHHGAQWDSIPKSARTHLQDAVPIRLGQEFRAYAATLKKVSRWITDGRDALRELGIGGSAAGTGINVPEGFRKEIIAKLEELTGEKLHEAQDLCEAMQSQSPVTYYSSMLRLMALELTRICNDLRLLASGPSTGLSELFLPSVQPGSSIMPGKVNPSILEMANQTWYSVLGYDQTVALCAQAGQLELNVMMPMMAYSAIEATRVAGRTLEVLRTRCIDGIKPNRPRLLKYFEASSQIATALSPRLGYEQTAKLVQEALKAEKSVIDLVRERKLIPEDELKKLLDLRTLTGD